LVISALRLYPRHLRKMRRRKKTANQFAAHGQTVDLMLKNNGGRQWLSRTVDNRDPA
jgi:hypothetical protein